MIPLFSDNIKKLYFFNNIKKIVLSNILKGLALPTSGIYY